MGLVDPLDQVRINAQISISNQNEVHMLWGKIKGWEGMKARRETHLLPACV